MSDFFLYIIYSCFRGITKIYSNKKDKSDFHGTVSFGPNKMSQQNLNQNVYQTSETQKLVII